VLFGGVGGLVVVVFRLGCGRLLLLRIRIFPSRQLAWIQHFRVVADFFYQLSCRQKLWRLVVISIIWLSSTLRWLCCFLFEVNLGLGFTNFAWLCHYSKAYSDKAEGFRGGSIFRVKKTRPFFYTLSDVYHIIWDLISQRGAANITGVLTTTGLCAVFCDRYVSILFFRC